MANALGTLGQGIANYQARTPSGGPTTKTTSNSGDFTQGTGF